MNKQQPVLFIFFLSISFVYSQKKQEYIRPGEKGSYLYRESYSVLETDTNVRSGPYNMYYEGEKIVSGNYSNNLKNGLWKYNNIDGEIFFQGNYTDNKQNGVWKYYKNQKPLCIIYFKNDKPDSLWQSFYENGKIQAKKEFKNGVKTGKELIYFENGIVATERSYFNDSLIGLETVNYVDGKNKFIIEYKSNEPYNILSMNDSLGNPLNPGSLKNGQGILKFYNSQGELYSEVEYNGRKNGIAKLYKKNKPLITDHYTDGIKSGEHLEYREDGSLIYKGEYQNGVRSGIWTFYSSNGAASVYKDYSSDTTKQSDTEVSYIPFTAVSQTMPHAQGGEAGMMKFIIKNIIYPQLSKEAGISGTVYVTFIVDRIGNTKETRIIRGRSAELDQESLRIVSNFPPWSPGLQNGFPVNVQFNIPIKFTLR